MFDFLIQGFQDSNMDLLLEYEYNQFWSDFTSVPYASNEVINLKLFTILYKS